MFVMRCSVCGTVPWPFEPILKLEQADGSELVYGSLCVCACDPRYVGPGVPKRDQPNDR